MEARPIVGDQAKSAHYEAKTQRIMDPSNRRLTGTQEAMIRIASPAGREGAARFSNSATDRARKYPGYAIESRRHRLVGGRWRFAAAVCSRPWAKAWGAAPDRRISPNRVGALVARPVTGRFPIGPSTSVWRYGAG